MDVCCAATLDSLMGRDRNEYGANAKKGASFKAESVRQCEGLGFRAFGRGISIKFISIGSRNSVTA